MSISLLLKKPKFVAASESFGKGNVEVDPIVSSSGLPTLILLIVLTKSGYGLKGVFSETVLFGVGVISSISSDM